MVDVGDRDAGCEIACARSWLRCPFFGVILEFPSRAIGVGKLSGDVAGAERRAISGSIGGVAAK